MPTIHLLAPFHTVLTPAASHCAFSMKAYRFSKMLHLVDDRRYKIIEYANEGSTSEADEHVPMLTTDEYRQHYKPEVSSPGAQANINTPGFALFCMRLNQALEKRSKMGDIVAHTFGPNLHHEVVKRFPGLIHVETGIGYPWEPMGCYPIFESEAWRHYQWGRRGNPGGVLPDGNIALTTARTWVIPNYFDADDWPVGLQPENAVAFMSRFVVDKGIEMLKRVIKAYDQKHPGDGLMFKLAGMGDFPGWFAGANFTPTEAARINYHGVVTGVDRGAFLGAAKAFILPAIFVEPFGGAAVESMLCGTPVLTPTHGAYTETVTPEVGFRCRTADDYVRGIEQAVTLDRLKVAASARARFSLDACAQLYDAVFRELTTRPSIG